VAAVEPDDVVLGGGNVRNLEKLPPGCRAGNNANAFLGGFRLWENPREQCCCNRSTTQGKDAYKQNKENGSLPRAAWHTYVGRSRYDGARGLDSLIWLSLEGPQHSKHVLGLKAVAVINIEERSRSDFVKSASTTVPSRSIT
jgi:hypothetical protein